MSTIKAKFSKSKKANDVPEDKPAKKENNLALAYNMQHRSKMNKMARGGQVNDNVVPMTTKNGVPYQQHSSNEISRSDSSYYPENNKMIRMKDGGQVQGVQDKKQSVNGVPFSPENSGMLKLAKGGNVQGGMDQGGPDQGGMDQVQIINGIRYYPENVVMQKLAQGGQVNEAVDPMKTRMAIPYKQDSATDISKGNDNYQSKHESTLKLSSGGNVPFNQKGADDISKGAGSYDPRSLSDRAKALFSPTPSPSDESGQKKAGGGEICSHCSGSGTMKHLADGGEVESSSDSEFEGPATRERQNEKAKDFKVDNYRNDLNEPEDSNETGDLDEGADHIDKIIKKLRMSRG